MNEAFVYDAVRTPRGRGKKDGALHTVRPVDLARQVLVAVRERNHVDTRHVEDVILGCVTAIGFNLPPPIVRAGTVLASWLLIQSSQSGHQEPGCSSAVAIRPSTGYGNRSK